MMQIQKKPADNLIKAYNQMLIEMGNAFEQADAQATDQPGKRAKSQNMTLQLSLEAAQHQAVKSGRINANEAYELGEYIKRDINDAAEYMMETSDQFYDWLALDIEVIERKVIDTFLLIANKTRMELERFQQTEKVINPQTDADGHR
ncbi:MAG: hypothetical protein RQ982_08515 [Gammaproteobacteria bacterium]|nr:hypothetical protein [Gammaproteobacteria bacterium]